LLLRVGCGVLIEHDGERILGVSGDPAHPANFGKLCSKGSTLHLTGDLSARALYPELRLGKGLARSRTDWDTALDHAASVFARTIAEHGPDSVAFYISGQLLTEDYYAFNKLARALVGTNNIDSNSRLCMSSAVVGYKRSLGADAPPCSYEDLESSDCVMIVGSNMAYAHPVLFRRLEEAKSRRPQMKVIVIDPRRTDTCDLADLHLAILPGTDVALFHGFCTCCCGKTGSTTTSSKRTPRSDGTQASGTRLHAFDGCAAVWDQRRTAAPVRRMGRHL
jgi:assimilatory nitrate reductase catalytic subunit